MFGTRQSAAGRKEYFMQRASKLDMNGVWRVVFPYLFSCSQWYGLLVAELFFFPLQILCASFYLPKVLLEAWGRWSQALRTRRGQIKKAFQHLGSSFVPKKTVYSQICYSCCLFSFISALHWHSRRTEMMNFPLYCRYNKASFPIYLNQKHLEMKAMVQGGLVTLFPWQGPASQTKRSISHVVVICSKNCHRWC